MMQPDPADHSAAPARRRSRAPRWLFAITGGVLLLCGLLSAWLLLTSSGLSTLAELGSSRSGGSLRLHGASGRLLDETAFERIEIELAGLRIEAREVRIGWDALALARGRLVIARLGIGGLWLASRPSDRPAAAPETLALPVEMAIAALDVAEFELREWAEQGFGASRLRIERIVGQLSADAAGLRTEALSARLPWGEARLAGRISARSPFELEWNGHLDGRYQDRDFSIELALAGDLLRPRAQLRGSGAGVAGEALLTLRSFEGVPLERAQISLGEIDPAALADGAPNAALQIDADFVVAPAPPGTPPRQWQISGPLRLANRLPGPWNEGRLPVEALSAQLSGTAEALLAEQLTVALAGGGRIDGRLEWQPAEASPLGQLRAALQLAAIDPQALDGRLPKASLVGTLTADGDRERQTFAAQLNDRGIEARLEATQQAGRVEVQRLRLRRGSALVEGSGGIDLAGAQAFAFALGLRAFDPRAWHASAPRGDLNGELRLSGELSPRRLRADFRLASSRLAGRALEGAGRLTLDGQRLVDTDLWLAMAGNRLEVRGAWGGEGDRLAISADAVDLSRLADGLGGSARLRGTLSGTPAAPAGELVLSATRLVLPGGWRLSAANLQGALQRGLDGPLVFAAGIGELRGPGGGRWLERAGLGVEGSRADHRIDLNLLGAEGDALLARLAGGLGEALAWSGRLESLETLGRLALKLEAPARLEASRAALRLESAALRSAEGRIELTRTEWGPGGLIAQGRLSGLGFGLVQDAGGQLRRHSGELRLGGEWDLRLDSRVNGTARLYREAGDLVLIGDATARLGLQNFEARLSAHDGEVAMSLQAEGSALGRLAASATARAEAHQGGWRLVPDAALLGSARLDMPSIAWLGPLLEASLGTAGQLVGEFSLSGTPAAPVATGRVQGKALELSLADVGLRLYGGSLEASFDRDMLRVSTFEFVSPNRVKPAEPRIPLDSIVAEPGRLRASGAIDLASGEGRFTFSAERLPLLQRTDRWLAVSGRGQISSGWQRLEIEGQLTADAGAISIGESPPPSLSDDVVILGQERKPDGFAISSRLDLQLGRHFYFSALGLNTRLAGGLRLQMNPGHAAVASGAIRMRDGVFEGYGQKLTVEEGLVSFAGDPENPSLNVTALRKGLEVEAGIAITGTVRRPKVKLVSSPNVPDPEKLSWIVLGRAPDSGNSADLGLLIPAAQALLGGPGGGLTSQLSNSLGLDQLSIGQGDLNAASRGATSSVVDSGVRSSAGTVSGQVVTIGKRLGSDTFLAFEQSLVGAQSIVKLTHQLGRRISVVARGGTDNAIDVYFTYTFR